MNSKIFTLIIILSSFALVSCGGSSGGSSGGGSGNNGITYSGSQSQASVSPANAQKLAIAATGGASQAIAADSADSANPLTPKGVQLSSHFTSRIIEQLDTLLTTKQRIANTPIAGLCDSGSADLVQNNDGTQGTIVFSNCLVTGGNGEALSGVLIFSGTVSGSTVTSLSIRFINFVVTHAGQTQTVNMTISCNGTPLVCNIFSDFVGLDGRIYRVQVTAVTNLSGTSFVAVATVFDPEHGSSTINASLNYNNCPSEVPVSGTITITGAAVTTATVVFNDCDSFNVTHMGISTNYLWADIL